MRWRHSDLCQPLSAPRPTPAARLFRESWPLRPAGTVAVLMGQLRFRPVAGAMILGTAVRLVSAVALTKAGKGLNGAIASTVIGELVTALCLIAILRESVTDGAPEKAL